MIGGSYICGWWWDARWRGARGDLEGEVTMRVNTGASFCRAADVTNLAHKKSSAVGALLFFFLQTSRDTMLWFYLESPMDGERVRCRLQRRQKREVISCMVPVTTR